MTAIDKDNCPGCGMPLRDAVVGGIAVVNGRTVSYLLCSMCAAAALADPEHLATQIELRLRDVEGNA